MEFNIKKANFILKTADILNSNVVADFPVSNYKGSINSTRTSITWNGVCIKNILDKLYDDYELFNISLIMVGYPIGPTGYGVTAEDRTIHFGITGLDWVYTNYNAITGNTSRESLCNAITFVEGQANNFDANHNPSYTFRKCITTDITINLYTIMGTLPNMNVATIFPQLTFDFVITPIQ
jgi:hypothetical protein